MLNIATAHAIMISLFIFRFLDSITLFLNLRSRVHVHNLRPGANL